MSVKTIYCGMTLEEVAESALRVFGRVDPGCAARYGGLSSLARLAWAKLAEAVFPVLVKFEGARWGEVATEVFACWSECFGPAGCGYAWEELPILGQIAWQAVARHLAWLFDLEERPDAEELAQAESRYGDEWTKALIAPQRSNA